MSFIGPILKNKLVTDYILTFFFAGLGAVINFFIIKIIFNNFGDESFFQYSYLKRLLSFLLPLSLLGLSVSLTKSTSVDKNANRTHSTLLLVSLVWTLVTLFLIGLALLIIPDIISNLIWGESSEFLRHFDWIILLFLTATAMMSLNYALFRGKMKMLSANLVEFCTQSFAPIIFFAFASEFIDGLKYLSISLFVINFLIAARFIFTYHPFIHQLKEKSYELLSFGLPRLPGDIAFYLLMFIPSFLSVHLFSIEISGILSFSIMLISVSLIVIQPISVLSLSRAVNLITTNEMVKLRTETYNILKLMLLYTVTVTIILELALPIFIELFFDVSFLKYLEIIRLSLLATPFLGIFYTLRGVIDAYYHKPIVGNISFVAMAFFCIMSLFVYLFDLTSNLFIVGFIMSNALLAILCLIQVRKFLKLK